MEARTLNILCSEDEYQEIVSSLSPRQRVHAILFYKHILDFYAAVKKTEEENRIRENNAGK